MTKRKHMKRRVRDRASKTGESYTAALRHLRARAEEASVATSSTTKFAVNCSFCNKHNGEVKKLIAGPGVYICNECIGLCNTILDEETNGGADSAPAPSLDEAPVDQLVMILGAMARTTDSMEARLGEWARKLVERGVPISTIAAQIGLTEVEARARFGL